MLQREDKMKKLFILICVCFMLNACGLTKKDLGLQKSIPDETKVETRKPLDLPPNFDELPD